MSKRNTNRHDLPELTEQQRQIREVIGQIPRWLEEFFEFEPGSLKFELNSDRENFLSTFESRITQANNQPEEAWLAEAIALIQAERANAALDAEKHIIDQLDKSYDQAGKGSRPQWSKDNESRGESYARTQGFKSGILIAKRHVLAALHSEQEGEE